MKIYDVCDKKKIFVLKKNLVWFRIQMHWNWIQNTILLEPTGLPFHCFYCYRYVSLSVGSTTCALRNLVQQSLWTRCSLSCWRWFPFFFHKDEDISGGWKSRIHLSRLYQAPPPHFLPPPTPPHPAGREWHVFQLKNKSLLSFFRSIKTFLKNSIVKACAVYPDPQQIEK